MDALRTVMLMLGCGLTLVLLPGSEAVGRVSVGTSLDVALPTRSKFPSTQRPVELMMLQQQNRRGDFMKV